MKDLLILSTATWRISSLLTSDFEDGPYKILKKFREFAKQFTEVFECIYCTSVWVGLIITGIYWYSKKIAKIITLPFSLSAIAIAWDKWNG